MLVCAELLLILARSAQLQILAKPGKQRTATENLQVKRGMARSRILEALVFVPASVVLVFITVRPIVLSFLSEPLRIRATADADLAIAFYGSLGITSYGFPFGAIRRLVTRIAMNTLMEFSTITHTGIEEGEQGPQERSTVA
jgi:hypothetical protein